MIESLSETIDFIKSLYPDDNNIPLHRPVFGKTEKDYILETIEHGMVSSVGSFVNEFEDRMKSLTGTKHAVATVNGTSALHLAMMAAGVGNNDEVITQALTFVATTNAITYSGSFPVFIDVDKDTMGMSPDALQDFLENNAERKQDFSVNKYTGRKITACIPMHTFGLCARIDRISEICKQWNIILIEDAAESIGSYFEGSSAGSFGEIGVYSLNGNKIITSGGGGCIVTDNRELAIMCKHISTQAKVNHSWEYVHDRIGYNYRMPNINAALACAQLESLSEILRNKRKLHNEYKNFFELESITLAEELAGTNSNYWLNAIIMRDKETRNQWLKETNLQGIMTRPIWQLMFKMPMFNSFQVADMTNSLWLEEKSDQYSEQLYTMNVVIVGYSGHAFVVLEALKCQEEHSVLGYCEPQEKKYNPYRLDYFGNELEEKVIDRIIEHDAAIFPAIGSNKIREKIVSWMTDHSISSLNVIHPKANISNKIELGNATLIAAGVVVNPFVSMGDGVIVNTGAIIEHECFVGKYSHVATGAVLAGNVKVGNGCFIGANSVVKEGISIGNSSIIGAGSVVVADVPPNVTYVGNPAKRLR